MRKVLHFLLLLTSMFVNAQVFQENFNNGLPSTWTIGNNGSGIGQSWSSSPVGLGNNGTIAALVNNETATPAAPIEDWLITPLVSLTGVNNPQLVFWGKTQPAGPNRNSVLKVMISTTGTNFEDFQLLETFTETYSGALNPISPNANFSLKTINLTGYNNQDVYIAFLMENTGIGKGWLIDDVAFFDQCLDVSDIQISNVNLTSGSASWSNPGGASSFEIELVAGNSQPTGVPTYTTTTTSVNFPLTQGVNYKVFVRAICTGNTSEWVASAQFTPLIPGSDCYSAMNINSLPFTHSDTTANYGDDYGGSPGTSCGITGSYLNGDDVVYAYTATENMIINVEMIPQATYSGIFIYDSCENIGVTCVAGVANANASVRNINGLSLQAGVTYYFVISTRTPPQSVDYTLNIQRVFCAQPINLTASNFTQTSAQLGWINGIGNNATSWQVFVQPLNGGLPVIAGVGVTSSTPVVTQLQNGTALQPSTMYEYYVRSACGDGNFSPWSGPFVFHTLCSSFDLPFSEGFNSNSLTEICWSVINNNNDTRLWDLNYTQTPFEGNQSASMNAAGSGNATNDDYLVSPVFNFNGQYRLRYKYKVSSATAQNFSVKMSQNGGASITDFTTTLVPDTGYTNLNYKEKIVYLPNFVGAGAITWHVSTNMVSRVFIDDVVIETVPDCPEPYDVENISSTDTELVLDWQQFGTVASWDVVLVPAGTPFTGDLTGLTVYNTTSKPYTVSGLISGTLFDVYIKSNCSVNSQSTWSIAAPAFTNASNDECIDAVEIPINPSTDCIVNVKGSLIGTTNSNLGTVCTGQPNNDVWFQFTATQSTHILNISNIVGDITNLHTVLYSGDCTGGLTQIECDVFSVFSGNNTYYNLVAGTTYYIKVYTLNSPTNTTFDLCLLKPLEPIRTSKDEYTVPQLVTDILINNPCAEVSNISWSTGANQMGIGYFDKNNSSFSYENGIILSSGNVLAAPGPKGQDIQAGTSPNWGGDADLSAVLAQQGLTGSLNNTTIIEFDFKAITNQMSFNFIFASEEYGGYQCNFSDVFAFLLTDLNTGVTTNLAVIPNTNIPVSVTTIRDSQFNAGCSSENVEYFDSYYNGTDAASIGAPINFRGHTVSMKAQSVVVPGATYHIKLAIADYNDTSHDSAVFIEGGSFQLGEIDLGSDLTVEENSALCSESSYTLDSGIDLTEYTIEWFKDGEVIIGENGPELEVSESGIYTIEATYIGSTCAISDSIKVEIYPLFIDNFAQPNLLKVCNNDVTTIDLTVNEAVMLNGISPDDFKFEYFLTLADLQNNTDKIVAPEAFFVDRSQDIFVKVKNVVSGCEEFMKFRVEFIVLDKPTIIPDEIVCSAYLLPLLPEGQKYYTGPNGTGNNLPINSYLNVGKHKIYVRSVNDICSEEVFFEIEVLGCFVQKGISPNGDGLNDFLDLEFFNATKVQIYNRFGQEVFSHGQGYTNQWYGQNDSGGELPSGTYFYSIVTPFENYTGWIQLVR